MSTKPISEFLPYKFLWPSDEEWLKTVMTCERYDLLKQKTSRDLTDEEAEIVNKQLESSSVETGILYEDAVDVIPCKYTYEESDVLIESIDDSENKQLIE